MRAIYPQLQVLPQLERQVTFVTAQELEDRYPDLTSKEREHAFVREHIRRSSSASAAHCAPASRMTAARRTMTTGR